MRDIAEKLSLIAAFGIVCLVGAVPFALGVIAGGLILKGCGIL